MAIKNGDGQDQIFVTMLVIVIIAAGAAIKYYNKNTAKKNKQKQKNKKNPNPQNNAEYELDEKRWENLQLKFANIKNQSNEKIKRQSTKQIKKVAKVKPSSTHATITTDNKKTQRNDAGGMEMLTRKFLLMKTANVTELDKRDVEMRQMAFNELARRNELNEIKGEILKAYAVNRDNIYGKTIQCLAMKTLAERTTHKNN